MQSRQNNYRSIELIDAAENGWPLKWPRAASSAEISRMIETSIATGPVRRKSPKRPPRSGPACSRRPRLPASHGRLWRAPRVPGRRPSGYGSSISWARPANGRPFP
jgi:hypothetical protein